MNRGQLGTALRHVQALIDQNSAASSTDADLVLRFAQHRDEAAFAMLVQRHGKLVLHVCRNLLHHEADAEDAFQAAFLVLARQAASIRKRTSLASWLHGVAFRTAMNLRKSAMRRHRHESIAARQHSLEVQPIPEAALKELQTLLDEEIQGLAERYRAPFILCCLEGKSRAEASQALGLKEGTVSSRLAKARTLLQDRLTARGVSLSAALSAAALSQTAAPAVAATVVTATIRAALAFAAGQGTAMISARVATMAEGVLRGMLVAKVISGLALAFVVLLGVVAAGALVAQQRPGEQQAKKETGPSIPTAEEVSDRKTEPLPDGAAALLGTRRFRHDGNLTGLAFTADNMTLVGHTIAGIIIWDAATGLEKCRLPARDPASSGSMDISPDGTTLAVSEGHSMSVTNIGLWDLHTGKKKRVLSFKNVRTYDQQNYVRFSGDGKSLAICHVSNGKFVIFDLESGEVRYSFGGPDSPAYYNFAISSDCKTLAIAANPRSNTDPTKHRVQLGDMATGKLIRVIQELEPMSGPSFVRSICFARDGSMLAFGIMDERATGIVMLFDPATGKKLRQFESKNMGQTIGIAFTPDGKRLLASGEYDSAIHVWDIATGKLERTLRGRHMSLGRAMALSPDGKTVALGTVGHTMRLWDVATGTERLTEHHGHDSQINSLAFSPDGKTLASAGAYPPIRLWNAATRQCIGTLPRGARSMCFSPDGKELVTNSAESHNHADHVRIWDLAEGKERLAFAVPGKPDVTAARYSVDGQKLFTLDLTREGDGKGPWKYCVRHWDAATGKQDHHWPVPPKASLPGSSLSADGKNVIASDEGAISIFNADSGRTRFYRGQDSDIERPPTLSPDGRLLASGTPGPDVHVRVREIVTGKEIFLLKGHQQFISAIAWSRDGHLVASSDRRAYGDLSTAQTIRVWDMASGNQVVKFGGFKSDVTALAFSPDGTTLAAGLRDSAILLYDVGKAKSKLTPAPNLSKDDLESRWTDLGSDDAGRAHRAIGALVSAPAQAVRFLQHRANPTPPADPDKVRRWIADLNSETFVVRQVAARELVKLDTQVESPIRKSIEKKVSVETRRRLELVLSTIYDVPDADLVRMIRAVTVLERIGSTDAVRILKALAAGTPASRVTQEAALSLKRLGR